MIAPMGPGVRAQLSVILVLTLGLGGCREPTPEASSQARGARVSDPQPSDRPATGPVQLRWSVASESLDPLSLARVHAGLVSRVETVAGVEGIEDCSPRQRLVIELDSQRLRATGLAPSSVRAALERGLAAVPSAPDPNAAIAALRALPVPRSSSSASEDPREGPVPARLGELAALRYSFADASCVAASPDGLAASATATLSGPAALQAARSVLADAARELPPELRLSVFGPEDAAISLSFPPGTKLEEAAERIAGGLARDSSWLVEAGVPAPLCVSGPRVRLSVPGPAASISELLTSLRSIPGVEGVEALGVPGPRTLWLRGPEPERIQDLGDRLAAEIPGLEVHTPRAGPRLEIIPDPAALARVGLSAAAVQAEIEIARGLELAPWLDVQGAPLTVVIRLAGLDGEIDQDHEAQALADLPLALPEATDSPAIPLAALASFERRRGIPSPCLLDERPALRVSVPSALEPQAVEAVLAELTAEGPTGLDWRWDA